MIVDQLSFNNSTRDPLYDHIMSGIGADCQRTNPQVDILAVGYVGPCQANNNTVSPPIGPFAIQEHNTHDQF